MLTFDSIGVILITEVCCSRGGRCLIVSSSVIPPTNDNYCRLMPEVRSSLAEIVANMHSLKSTTATFTYASYFSHRLNSYFFTVPTCGRRCEGKGLPWGRWKWRSAQSLRQISHANRASVFVSRSIFCWFLAIFKMNPFDKIGSQSRFM